MILTKSQLLRWDYMSRQKQWEDEQARSAPELVDVLEDEEKELNTEALRIQGARWISFSALRSY